MSGDNKRENVQVISGRLKILNPHTGPEVPDQELALRVRQYLKEKFPNGIEECLSQMSVDELPDFFMEIEKDAEVIMDVTTEEVVIIYPKTRRKL